MRHDLLADAMNALKTSEAAGKKTCTIQPASKITQKVLDVLKVNKYIEGYTFVEDGKAGYIDIKLSGRMNNCGVIKPRYPVQASKIELWEKKYLPARGFGLMLLSTSTGILTHTEAKAKNTGGTLLAYVY